MDDRTRIVPGDPRYRSPTATLTARFGGEIVTFGKGTAEEKEVMGRENPYEAGAHAAFWWLAVTGSFETHEWGEICDSYAISALDKEQGNRFLQGWADVVQETAKATELEEIFRLGEQR